MRKSDLPRWARQELWREEAGLIEEAYKYLSAGLDLPGDAHLRDGLDIMLALVARFRRAISQLFGHVIHLRLDVRDLEGQVAHNTARLETLIQAEAERTAREMLAEVRDGADLEDVLASRRPGGEE